MPMQRARDRNLKEKFPRLNTRTLLQPHVISQRKPICRVGVHRIHRKTMGTLIGFQFREKFGCSPNWSKICVPVSQKRSCIYVLCSVMPHNRARNPFSYMFSTPFAQQPRRRRILLGLSVCPPT